MDAKIKRKSKMVGAVLPMHIVERLHEEKERTGIPINRQITTALEKAQKEAPARK